MQSRFMIGGSGARLRFAAAAFWVVAAAVLPVASCRRDSAEQAAKNDTPPADQATPAAPQVTDATAAMPSAPVKRRVFNAGDGSEAPVSTGAAAGYVPDTACRDCHADLYRSYQEVGMFKSFYRPSADNVIEDFGEAHFYHSPSDEHYEMELRDGRYVQRRYQLDATEKRIHEHEVAVDFIVGSGNNVRTYLTQNAAGELYQLPLAWYSKSKKWGMNPGYDIPSHFGFSRQIERECMFCHNAYPADVPVGRDLAGQPHNYPKDLPMGVGCQRCHGPGADHVEAASTSGTSMSDVVGSIVNPAKLAPQAREDVCLQCHLQPSLSPPGFLRVLGRGDYSYRPGEPLDGYLVYMDYAGKLAEEDLFEINHHPYRLAQSQCKTEAGETLSCLTCHDPHRKVKSSDRIAHYQQKCYSCHGREDCTVHTLKDIPERLASARQANECVACHMPLRRAQDVIQVMVTDHKIRRALPPDDFTEPLPEFTGHDFVPPEPYWPDRAPPEPLLNLYLSMFGMVGTPAEHTARVAGLIEQTAPAHASPHLYLAHLQSMTGDPESARKSYESITQKFPGMIKGYTGLGGVLMELGQNERAVDVLQQSVKLMPDYPEARYLLGTALFRANKPFEAAAEFRETLRLRPYHTAARFNLARCYALSASLPAAIGELKQLLAIDPRDDGACIELGLLLMEFSQFDEAVRYLRRGAQTAPNIREMGLHLAVALLVAGESQQSLNELSRNGGPSSDLERTVAAIARAQIDRQPTIELPPLGTASVQYPRLSRILQTRFGKS